MPSFFPSASSEGTNICRTTSADVDRPTAETCSRLSLFNIDQCTMNRNFHQTESSVIAVGCLIILNKRQLNVTIINCRVRDFSATPYGPFWF